MGQSTWGEEHLDSLKRKLKRPNRMLVQSFSKSFDSDLYTRKVFLHAHMQKIQEILNTTCVPQQLIGQLYVHINKEYKLTSERRQAKRWKR